MKYLEQLKAQNKVSQIGLGISRFGTIIDKSLSFEMLDMFVEKGGTLVDTARNYYEWVENGRGKSEECLGKWIESRSNRDEVVISTKGGVRNDGNNWTIDLSIDNLIEEINQSLDAIRTNRVDIYLLHRDDRTKEEGEIIYNLQTIAEKANVDYLGVANWRCDRIRRANEYALAHELKGIDIVQTWWSIGAYTSSMWNDPNTTNMDRDTYEYMLANDMVGMAYTSQCKGFFQKASTSGVDGIGDLLKERICTTKNKRILEYILKYSRENGVSVTDVVNSYITSNPLKGIALVSCSSIEQLKDIMTHCDHDLEQSFIDKIDRLK